LSNDSRDGAALTTRAEDLLAAPELIAGACDLAPAEDGAVRFQRFPRELQAFCTSTAGWRIRSHCTAGVRIRFRSDTRLLRLAVRYGEAVPRNRFALDVEVDGRLSGSFGAAAPGLGARWSGTLFTALERKTRDFIVWLPHLCEVLVERMEIEDGAALEPAKPAGRRWLALGDSITQGFVADGPSRSYVSLTAKALGVELANLGFGGAKAAGELAAAGRAISADLITIALGVNDYASHRSAADFAASVGALLRGLREAQPNARMAWITPIPYHAFMDKRNQAGLLLQDYAEIIRRQAASVTGVEVIAGEGLVPDEARWFVDNCHPNDAGHAAYAANLVKALRPILRREENS